MKILREEDVSMGFRGPECAHIVAVPLCNICKNLEAEGGCKVLDERPKIYSEGEDHDCPHFILDKGSIAFPPFAKLYPDIVKQLEEKVNTD